MNVDNRALVLWCPSVATLTQKFDSLIRGLGVEQLFHVKPYSYPVFEPAHHLRGSFS